MERPHGSATLDTLLGDLRSALVADLLSGSHGIPESYDSVIVMASSSEISETAVQEALVARLTKKDMGWTFVEGDSLPRELDTVLLEGQATDALLRLNPAIAEKPERVNEVVPKLRAVLLSVVNDGLLTANEEMVAWLCGRRTIRFSETEDYVPIRLVDFDDPRSNDLIVSTEVVFPSKKDGRRYDMVLFVNGFPLVVGETKTPVSRSKSWLDGANDIHVTYEVQTPAFFVPNVLNFSSEGKELRYGAAGQPPETWMPWFNTTDDWLLLPGLSSVMRSAELLLTPEMVLDILRSFTMFSRRSSTSGGYLMKIIPRVPPSRGGGRHRREGLGHRPTPRTHLASPGFREDVAHGLCRGQVAAPDGPGCPHDPRRPRSP